MTKYRPLSPAWEGILQITSNPDDDGSEPADDPNTIIKILEEAEDKIAEWIDAQRQ